MARTTIPFNGRFKDVMLNGQKIMTSRTKRYGEVGDKFEAFGSIFVITDQHKNNLGDIALNFFIEEGCSSSADFMDVWKNLHPKKGWDPEQLVWVHKFQKEAEQKKLEV